MTLIERLEATESGSRELDYVIAKEIGWRFDGEKEFKEYGFFWRDATTDEWKQLPWWTTSLDAALTLMPEGRYYTIRTCTIRPQAIVHCLPDSKLGNQYGEAATIYLAFCAAALRAREVGMDERTPNTRLQ